jgi:hypothetical protein
VEGEKTTQRNMMKSSLGPSGKALWPFAAIPSQMTALISVHKWMCTKVATAHPIHHQVDVIGPTSGPYAFVHYCPYEIQPG